MATFPTPTGGNTTAPVLALPANYTLQQYAANFDAKFPGKGAGAAFLGYAQAHPSLTARQAAEAFALEIALLGVDKAVAESVAAVGQFTGATPGAVAAGADVLGRFNLSGWFLRIGEILVGLVLIGIGLNSMLGGRPLKIVTSTAGLAGKVAA
jgi:hypothetical protein